ncbi:complex I subunit 5 family protein [Halorhodospira halochloris]|uniref:complex I subunit 5 family protein n=1 Tax=Halorhodospira halochloris TaxID=1052 RepID=UPI001EE92A7E|nr:complex I subunit 5 family protein [Halorhodospira halochloris]MCG5530031.1 complex I subunit 5 family protein [Halorhodospira halochloris]
MNAEQWLLLLPLLAPLAIAPLLGRGRLFWSWPLVVIGLVLPLFAFASGAQLELPWALLQARFSVDQIAEPLLILAGPLWAAAVVSAWCQMRDDIHRGAFMAALAVVLAALYGVLTAADLASFYFAYALMTFAAYPLVVHYRTPVAFRAGRVYLTMAVLAEGAVLSAVLLLSAGVGNPLLAEVPGIVAEHPRKELLVGLLLLGFAVKAGAFPLHVWLPLAHPAAPVAASALLSGLVVKAALIAWLRMLPLGEVGLPFYGGLLMAAGIVTVVYANAVGIVQARPKTVLAYSTVSQMGLLLLAVGMALCYPQIAPAVFGGALLFAVHHGLAKGALFLACGLSSSGRGWYMLLPAMAIAGVPLSSGALAKAAIKDGAYQLPAGELLTAFLGFASVLTTLLLLRFLWVAWSGRGAGHESDGRVQQLAVLGLIASSLCLPWLVAAHWDFTQVNSAITGQAVFEAAWPVLVGLGGAGIFGALFWSAGAPLLPRLPEGDWIKPAMLWGVRSGYFIRRHWRNRPRLPSAPSPTLLSARLFAAIESRLFALAMAGALFLALVLGISLIGLFAGENP